MSPSPITPQQKNIKQRGISLLEVLAALVILSIGASVAFTWLGQSMNTLSKIKSEESILLAQNEAIEYLRTLNPQDKSSGEVSMKDYTVIWTASLIKPTARTMTALGNPAKYEVSLYELDVHLVRAPGDQKWSQFKIQLAGYRKVGSGSTGLFGTSAR
jgi:general secretion pathway protein I